MAFPDTITVTVNAVAKVLIRVNSGQEYAAEYRLRGTLDEYRLRIKHTSFTDKARAGATINRHSAELTQTVYAVAPATVPTIRKSYVVLEESASDDVSVVQKFDEAFAAFLSAANITKLLNYES